MSLYNQEYNKDNVILRYVLVALLSDLKDKVYYYNKIDEDNVDKINIPFYYSMTGGERFLLDNFLYSPEENNKAIGDYEHVPRGIIQMNDLSIDNTSMTNKFVNAEFVKEVNGELKTFNLDTNFLPINIPFETTVICSNTLEMLKVVETVISKLYKANFYQVDLGMFRIESSYQIPEDFSQDKLFEFTINDKKEFKINFTVNVNTFIPVFEYGILLSEIDELIKTTGDGIGKYRDGEIKFGGIFEKFKDSVSDMELAPNQNILSNQQQKDNINKKGKIYTIDELNP